MVEFRTYVRNGQVVERMAFGGINIPLDGTALELEGKPNEILFRSFPLPIDCGKEDRGDGARPSTSLEQVD
jgi:hypothetical protein